MQSLKLKVTELPYEINEELKSLRTNIQFCGDDKRVLLMTSAFSGEGKSTIALDLARSFTELGKRVLLIDADMRKSVLMRSLMKHNDVPGLSHYLSGQCKGSDVICRTNIKNLFVVHSGKVPPNPAELIARPQMASLIEVGREFCDYVIIDCPPIGMVVDAAVVAPYCDGSLILIESGEVKYRLAQDVVARMEATKCPILGVVLNKVNVHKNGTYYGRYYGKYYGKYKGYYQEEEA